jgi:FkbM family methyltransferase
MNFLLRALRASDGFLDIGANVGYYTVLASTRVAPEAIWAVEAHPDNVKVLTEQLRLNRLEAVSVLARALGAISGQVRFSADARETGSVTERSDASTFVVEMCTLDSWLEPRARPPVIFAKIDVEGSELEVLAGASGLLGAGAVAVWLFELSAPNLARHGRTAADLVGCFARHGYDFYLWNESDRTIEAVNPLEHTEANFIACRRPLTWLRERLGI